MASLALPQWIAKMYPGKVGRDHLGLGSVSSDQILRTLSPGINVLTMHPRYYSFYTYLLDEFWRRDHPRSRDAWVAFYRPREFIFSLACHLCDRPEHGEMRTIVGSQKVSPMAASRLAEYDTGFNYIKSDLGGYGLYYGSVIAELGLIYPGGPGFPYPVDVPTEQGKQVAAAFRRAVRDTAYCREYFEHDQTTVPIAVVEDYARSACLCQLQLPTAPDRPQLLDAFLHAGSERSAEARRATFRLLLDLSAQTNGHPIDQDSFRKLLYCGTAEDGAIYDPQPAIVKTYRQWRLYQAREYYAFALEALWGHLCDWGTGHGGDVRPLPLARFWEYLAEALDFDVLASRLGVAPPGIRAESSFGSLLEWVRGLVAAPDTDFDTACGLDAPIHEHRLYRLVMEHRTVAGTPVAGMIMLLALLVLRFGRPERWLQEDWHISRMGEDGRLSLDGFVRTVRRQLGHGSVTIGELARWLYEDYIILQHQLVATSKLPDNTFRFQREGESLRFYQLENSLGFNDSRFGALSTTVHELGLCGDLRLPEHALTTDGARFLSDGDLRES